MKLSSSAFSKDGKVPNKFRWDIGENISPPLLIEDVPSETKSLALTLIDEDHPERPTHWLLYNVPADLEYIDENTIPDGAIQGRNNLTEIGYYGFSPMPGIDYYHFTLYALSAELKLSAGAELSELIEEMESKIITEAKYKVYCETTGEFSIE